jgi:hypothetical protein
VNKKGNVCIDHFSAYCFSAILPGNEIIYIYDDSSMINCNTTNKVCSSGDCICPYKYCINGELDNACNCNCDDNWGEKYCDTCIRTNDECFNGGFIHSGTCQCACIAECEHGTLNETDCSCSCNDEWGGNICNECGRLSSECYNNGTINSKICQCECPNECEHGTLNEIDCRCLCNGGWSGDLCNICTDKNASCPPNMKYSGDLCSCECINGFIGDDCNICPLKIKHCKSGILSIETCKCDKCNGNFTGILCDTCHISQSDCSGEDKFYESSCTCHSFNHIFMIIILVVLGLIAMLILMKVKCKILTKLNNCKRRIRNQIILQVRHTPPISQDNNTIYSHTIPTTHSTLPSTIIDDNASDMSSISRSIPTDVSPEISGNDITIQIHRDGKVILPPVDTY